MKNEGIESQTKGEQMLNSVETAHRAVEQAEEHPSERIIEQAENSVQHAEIAVRQAAGYGEPHAEQAAEQLAEDKITLEGR